MKKYLLLVAVFFLSIIVVLGQNGLKANIIHQQKAGEISLQAECKNQGTQKEAFSYEMWISKKGPNGNKIKNKQGGELTLNAGESEVVASTTLNYDPDSQLEVTLNIIQNNKRIASDTFKAGIISPIAPKPSHDGGAFLPEVQDADLEFGGIIIDYTRTRMGRELYDLFNAQWDAPSGVGDFTIKLEEFPFRGRTTRIVVWLDDEKLVETNMQPQYDYIERLSGFLVNRLGQILMQRKEAQRNLAEDLRDTGI